MIRLSLEERALVNAGKKILSGKRKADKQARVVVKPNRGREINKGFRAYIRRQPCEARHLGGCSGPIEAAHIRYNDGPDRLNPGLGIKNHDRHCNPLCHFHHQHDQHLKAERFFWERLGKDAYETAAAHYARYSEPQRWPSTSQEG